MKQQCSDMIFPCLGLMEWCRMVCKGKGLSRGTITVMEPGVIAVIGKG